MSIKPVPFPTDYPLMKLMFIRTQLLLLLVLLLPTTASAAELCLYTDATGRLHQVMSRDAVPKQYQGTARCMKARQRKAMAKPKEINLEGNVRRESINSEVGDIELRWPRSVEKILGKTPFRATVEAARAVSRTLKSSALSSVTHGISLDWQIVFMDANLPSTQIPRKLVTNCHPGWMTPPANIYIVAQRAAERCSGNRVSKTVADDYLAQVLIHEMGHAVEAFLLQEQFSRNRMRAEGFATWFEKYASKNSSMVNSRRVEKEMLKLATESFKQSPNYFAFRGSAQDYARASLYFSTIEKRFGIPRMMDIYGAMYQKRMPFFQAIQDKTSWNRQRLEKEVQKYFKKSSKR